MSQSPTVLVVDDNRPLADGFERLLSKEYDVLTAYNGTDARELLDESVDVVLLDRRLPDTTGDVLLEEIRSAGLDCRVAMISAADPSSDLDCDAYLTKPLSEIDRLHETVSQLVDGRGTSH